MWYYSLCNHKKTTQAFNITFSYLCSWLITIPNNIIPVRLNPNRIPHEDDIINTDEDESTADSDSSSNEDEWVLELYDRFNRNKGFFQPTNFGCFVCLQNFGDKNQYDDHILIHKKIKQKKGSPYGLLELSYTLGPDSNKLRFKISSYESDIVIERVVLVLESYNYVNLHELPYHMKEGEFSRISFVWPKYDIYFSRWRLRFWSRQKWIHTERSPSHHSVIFQTQ